MFGNGGGTNVASFARPESSTVRPCSNGGCGQFCNLFDEDGEIGTIKTHLWSGDTIVFDVGWNVFVMRMSFPESRLLRVRLRIVPEQFVLSSPDFVAVPVYDDWQPFKQNSFSNDQPKSTIKLEFARNTPQGSTTTEPV